MRRNFCVKFPEPTYNPYTFVHRMFFVWDIQASQITSSLRLALLMKLHWYNKRKASMSNSIVKGPLYSFFYRIPCRIHRRRVGFALPCRKAQVWLKIFHIPCQIHRRLPFWTHTIHLFEISNTPQYLPPTKKAFEPISSEHSNAKLPIKVFLWKRRAQIGDVASWVLNQEFSKHTNTHWWLSHIYKTWPVTTQFANDDEAAQQPGCNLNHKQSPHLSHELHKHVKYFTAKLFVAKNTFTCAVPQNGQKCVPNTGAVRKDLPSDKYRRSRS